VSSLDTIAHEHLMSMLGAFPARGMIRQWLKAGVVDVSPVLLNVALHGIETAAGVSYYTAGVDASGG
jgi:RNA-directed DNA polymerase